MTLKDQAGKTGIVEEKYYMSYVAINKFLFPSYLFKQKRGETIMQACAQKTEIYS